MKKRGRGISTIIHPTGFSGGGDVSTAMVRVNLDGSVDLLAGTVELGQGAKTVLAQIAAEGLGGIPFEKIRVNNEDTRVAPWDHGVGATRSTHYMGNAVMMAAKEARDVMAEIAASLLNCSPSDLEVKAGEFVLKANPDMKLPFDAVVMTAYFAMGKIIAGRGGFFKPAAVKDPETGAADSWSTESFGTCIAEVEVDTDTGEVSVIKLINAYDTGKAINPMLCEGQIEGGAVMGIGMALMENIYPANPKIDFQPHSLHDYVIPTAVDTGDLVSIIIEKPCANGPYGAKGFGEMTMNAPPAAISNAIYDAVGVRICELPITPELVLKGLEEKK